ncbi:MAG: TIGR02449 family protein [Pseudomonadales bacterium]|nr:TIGR02449 family protein [Pseudomonadales bacterium]MDA0760371.1 TIGR02449 family protein [Pseudomonadota bacterium]MDA0956240.1 TIGR02449 family protein [Pseudomonadota bacterium]MDA1207513.1 TIGR02449 family protein [Pseudomonadota bacterium]
MSQIELESKLDMLTELCEALIAERQQLATENQKLHQERAQLLARNVAVKSKVEAMILRLKSLEQE